MTTAETWGRIYAVIECVNVGGKLKPHEITNAALNPGLHFAEHYARIQRRLMAWSDQRLRDLLNNISPDDMDACLDLTAQGQFFLGLYHERTRLEDEQAKVIAGRPTKDSGHEVDWANMDWSLSDAQISQKEGISRQTAWAQRKRHAPK